MLSLIQHSFEELENARDYIPYLHIDYLYHHSHSDKIFDKIIDYLENHTAEPVMWYAIVAENYLCEELIEPLIIQCIANKSLNSWYWINLQIGYLAGALALKYPEQMAEETLTAFEKALENDKFHLVTPLLEVLYFIDLEKYKERIFKILEHPNVDDRTEIALPLADMGIQEVMPILKKEYRRSLRLSKTAYGFAESDSTERLAEAIQQLEEKDTFGDSYSIYRLRPSWKKFLMDLEKKLEEGEAILEDLIEYLDDNDLVLDIDADYSWEIPPPRHIEKIGRNDPCPCGSGKKYKKCCGRDKGD
jgi:uncharacterized protein YecA (UPF0149 family)